jgi:hypothetical protein
MLTTLYIPLVFPLDLVNDFLVANAKRLEPTAPWSPVILLRYALY